MAICMGIHYSNKMLQFRHFFYELLLSYVIINLCTHITYILLCVYLFMIGVWTQKWTGANDTGIVNNTQMTTNHTKTPTLEWKPYNLIIMLNTVHTVYASYPTINFLKQYSFRQNRTLQRSHIKFAWFIMFYTTLAIAM